MNVLPFQATSVLYSIICTVSDDNMADVWGCEEEVRQVPLILELQDDVQF
jgi:hypothetical protein